MNRQIFEFFCTKLEKKVEYLNGNTLINRYLKMVDKSRKFPKGRQIKVPEVRKTFENLKTLFIGASVEINRLLAPFKN